jgi:hypothetical protein
MPHGEDYNLEEDFPNLAGTPWRITSDPARKYNCIAYAAYDQQRYWDTAKGYYWPPGARRENTVEAWTAAFEVLLYKLCQDATLEDGYEKIALYAKASSPTHIARQTQLGTWTSKLGPDEDIEHITPEALEGKIYGEVVTCMRRRRSRE